MRWTEDSIQLAETTNYLDKLFKVYPMSENLPRILPEDIKSEIQKNFLEKDNINLVKNCIAITKKKGNKEGNIFPIKDSYVSFLKHSEKAIDLNPETVNRIAGRIRALGVDKALEIMESPKETNRQLGQVIYQWIEKETLGIKVYSDIEMFNNSKETKKILNGSDGFLQDYADKYIYDNCSLEEYEAFKDKNKGIDFLALIDGKLVIAEMKFLTDRGGHQDRQIDDALGLSSLEFSNDKVIPIALVDGVCYIEQEKAKKSMYKKIKRAEERKNYVMSVLVLQDFLFQL